MNKMKEPRFQHALRLALVCFAAFCSGAGSLIYQVVWIRRLTGVTSATATATAIVVGAFMAGLACGAWLAGRRLARLRKPLLIYALAELSAAALALVSIPVIESSELLRGVTLVAGLDLVTIWVPYTAVVLFLLVPTTLLGTSLPLMVAHDELQERNSAFFVNLIYGTNTLGAVCGALAAGFFTIEHLGLRRSLWLGAALACCASLAVLPVALRPASVARTRSADSPVVIGRIFLLVAFLCGAVALAAEIVWTRLMALVVLNTVYAYTEALVVVLIGISAGGYLGLLFCRWARAEESRPKLLGAAIAVLTLGAILIAAVPYALTNSPLAVQHLMELARGDSLRAVLTLCLIFSPAAAAIAFVLPVLALLAGGGRKFQSFSDLYAVNTWGGVAGSLLMGLLLLPWLGLADCVLLLGLLALAAAAVLCLRHPRPIAPAAIVVAGLAGVLGFSAATTLPQDFYRQKIGPAATLLDFRETALSDAMVTEDKSGQRRLWINSAWVAGTGGGHVSLGHLPAMLLQHRERALGIGIGTGQTFAAVMELGVKNLDCVEINRGVIELSEKWFSTANDGLTRKPGVHLYQDDGRAFLRETRSRYDLVILEPLQAWSAGTTQLYTRDFYQEASRGMTEHAILAQWIPFYGQDVESTRSMVATALTVFPNASLWLDYRDGILILRKDSSKPSWPELADELTAYFGRKGPLGRMETTADVLALFQMGPAGLIDWTRGAAILTDDRPFLEFAAARIIGQGLFGATLESIQGFVEDPAAQFERSGGDSAVFEKARIIRSTVQSSDLSGSPLYAGSLRELEAALGQVPDSGLLRSRYRLGVISAVKASGSPDESENLYLRAIAADPEFGEALYNLAVLYAGQDRMAEAIQMAQRAAENPRLRGAALQALALLKRSAAQ